MNFVGLPGGIILSLLICSEIFEEHVTGRRHPERPDRIQVIRKGYDAVEDSPWILKKPDREASLEELLYYHTEEYIETVKQASEQERALDADTPTSCRSYEVARLAAGTALNLTESGLNNGEAGFGAVRPPGHHAESEKGMGFCLFNNIVLAANHVTRQNRTVAIIDIDVHHGNGTQDAFIERDDVLYVSFHQYPFYPGTGRESETGSGEGDGYTMNVTLSSGSDWGTLERRWDGEIRDRIFDFDPDFMMVSAGFDAHRTDPIGGLNLTDGDYKRIARDLNRWSRKLCEGRLIGLLEGGYNLETLKRVVPVFTHNLLEE